MFVAAGSFVFLREVFVLVPAISLLEGVERRPIPLPVATGIVTWVSAAVA